MRIHPETPAVRGGLWAVVAAGLSTFAVVTTEMLPVGLMTPIAGAFNVPVGQAGLMISIPATMAVISAPLVILLAGNIDRRKILAGLLILLTLANIASALAEDLGWMLAARGLVGLSMGGIWAIAGGLAPRLVPEAAVGRATAVIFGGVAAASVLGVPLGTTIGEAFGWRSAFWVMAAFSLMVLALCLAVLPALPVRQSTKVSDFAAQLRLLPVLLGLLLTAFLVMGHFTAFTFIRPALLDHSGFAAEGLGLLLFAYGMAGILGNFLTGSLVARRLDLVLISIALGLAVAIAGIALWGHIQGVALMLLTLWGLGYGGVSVGLQTWMMRAAPGAVEIATALFVAVFNLAIAAGSGIGGGMVDGQGLQTTLLVAATLPMLALFLAIYMTRRA